MTRRQQWQMNASAGRILRVIVKNVELLYCLIGTLVLMSLHNKTVSFLKVVTNE